MLWADYYWKKPDGHIDLASQHTPLVRCFSCVDIVWFILHDNWDVWGTPAQSKQDHCCARCSTVFWSVLVLSSECITRPFDASILKSFSCHVPYWRLEKIYALFVQLHLKVCKPRQLKSFQQVSPPLVWIVTVQEVPSVFRIERATKSRRYKHICCGLTQVWHKHTHTHGFKLHNSLYARLWAH